jgi:glutamate synthase (NADPH/NADH) small chain
MRFGVPDAKLEKWIIDRRVAVLEQEGISFIYDKEVGRDISRLTWPPSMMRS